MKNMNNLKTIRTSENYEEVENSIAAIREELGKTFTSRKPKQEESIDWFSYKFSDEELERVFSLIVDYRCETISFLEMEPDRAIAIIRQIIRKLERQETLFTGKRLIVKPASRFGIFKELCGANIEDQLRHVIYKVGQFISNGSKGVDIKKTPYYFLVHHISMFYRDLNTAKTVSKIPEPIKVEIIKKIKSILMFHSTQPLLLSSKDRDVLEMLSALKRLITKSSDFYSSLSVKNKNLADSIIKELDLVKLKPLCDGVVSSECLLFMAREFSRWLNFSKDTYEISQINEDLVGKIKSDIESFKNNIKRISETSIRRESVASRCSYELYEFKNKRLRHLVSKGGALVVKNNIVLSSKEKEEVRHYFVDLYDKIMTDGFDYGLTKISNNKYKEIESVTKWEKLICKEELIKYFLEIENGKKVSFKDGYDEELDSVYMDARSLNSYFESIHKGSDEEFNTDMVSSFLNFDDDHLPSLEKRVSLRVKDFIEESILISKGLKEEIVNQNALINQDYVSAKIKETDEVLSRKIQSAIKDIPKIKPDSISECQDTAMSLAIYNSLKKEIKDYTFNLNYSRSLVSLDDIKKALGNEIKAVCDRANDDTFYFDKDTVDKLKNIFTCLLIDGFVSKTYGKVPEHLKSLSLFNIVKEANKKMSREFLRSLMDDFQGNVINYSASFSINGKCELKWKDHYNICDSVMNDLISVERIDTDWLQGKRTFGREGINPWGFGLDMVQAELVKLANAKDAFDQYDKYLAETKVKDRSPEIIKQLVENCFDFYLNGTEDNINQAISLLKDSLKTVGNKIVLETVFRIIRDYSHSIRMCKAYELEIFGDCLEGDKKIIRFLQEKRLLSIDLEFSEEQFNLDPSSFEEPYKIENEKKLAILLQRRKDLGEELKLRINEPFESFLEGSSAHESDLFGHQLKREEEKQNKIKDLEYETPEAFQSHINELRLREIINSYKKRILIDFLMGDLK